MRKRISSIFIYIFFVHKSENYEISENKEEECLNKESEVMWGEVTQGEVMGEAMGDATGEAK